MKNSAVLTVVITLATIGSLVVILFVAALLGLHEFTVYYGKSLDAWHLEKCAELAVKDKP